VSAAGRLPPADLAVVSGSGLAVVPAGAEVVDEFRYDELGWPASGVPGHADRLLVADWPTPGRRPLRLLLACGRCHLYEGRAPRQVGRAVDDLVAAGVRGLLATNAVGALDPALDSGDAVVVTSVIDLQGALHGPTRVLDVTDAHAAGRLARALSPHLRGSVGRYVAVPGPQYETPTEAAWLRSFGEVVGMSAGVEVRAARRHGLPVRVLSLVANRSGAVSDHAAVLGVAKLLETRLSAALAALVAAVLEEPV
jgi:purine-nucleoside phosphorylase